MNLFTDGRSAADAWDTTWPEYLLFVLSACQANPSDSDEELTPQQAQERIRRSRSGG